MPMSQTRDRLYRAGSRADCSLHPLPVTSYDENRPDPGQFPDRRRRVISEQTMSKQALALASLVMAIPAGFACYVCVMAIFGHNESMPMLMTIIMWTLSILCLVLALFPLPP